jgi:hypothetical protein
VRLKFTLNLHGHSFGLGDDEASIIFIQGGNWMAANVIPYAKNGYNGLQTVEVPLSAFYKVNDSSSPLNKDGTVSDLKSRFWSSSAYSVDVTSVKLSTGSVSTNMELLTDPWSFAASSGDDVKYHDIPKYSVKGKTKVRVTFDLHGTSFGLGDDEASVVFLQGGEWMGTNIIPYATNGQNGSQTVEIPLSSFHKMYDTPVLNTNANVDQIITRFWHGSPFHVDVPSIQVLGEEAEATGSANIAPGGTGYRWSQNASSTSNSNRVAATGINDGNETTDVDLNNGSDDNADAWEAAGVVWSASQSAITSVQYVNGTWDGNSNGAFTANVKLQFSTDGTTWTDSGWTISPAYDNDNSAVSGKTYIHLYGQLNVS